MQQHDGISALAAVDSSHSRRSDISARYDARPGATMLHGNMSEKELVKLKKTGCRHDA